MTAREAVLHSVRRAVAGTTAHPIPRDYEVQGPRADVVDAFVERVRDYRATVIVSDDALRSAREVLNAQAARRIGIAPDLEERRRPPGVELIEDRQLSPRDLDALDGALTTCAVACALTGTIALDGAAGQGRRALTLLPDLHVCIVRADQIVATVPELVRALQPSAAEGRPIVLVSGPSATSDIELERVEGVHGPRRLMVIVER